MHLRMDARNVCKRALLLMLLSWISGNECDCEARTARQSSAKGTRCYSM